MPNCPNCSYVLVLLSRRRRYKCAKCGRLYLQKATEDKSFRLWNIAQREIELHNLLIEIEQNRFAKTKLSREEKKQRAKEYKKRYVLVNKGKILAYQRAKYLENHEKELERCRTYRENNISKRTEAKKLWVAKNKNHYQQWLRIYLEKNKEKNRLKKRLCYWRIQQAKLADEMLKNKVIKTYTRGIDHSFSTFGLSEVLA